MAAKPMPMRELAKNLFMAKGDETLTSEDPGALSHPV